MRVENLLSSYSEPTYFCPKLLKSFYQQNIITKVAKHNYYKHLIFRETAYAATQGRNPISETMAMSENHFKLTYDNADRLVKIEYRIGEQLIETNRVGSMDATRDITSSTQIEYSGNFEIRHFFDETGKQRTNPMGVYKAVYEYNDLGERIGLKHFDKTDKPTNDVSGIFEYIWKDVNEGSVLEQRKNTSGEFVPIRPDYHFMNVLYTYNKNGILTLMQNINSSGDLVEEKTGIAIDRPVYDEHFQLTAFKFYDKKEKNAMGSFLSSAGGEITYDAKGNVTKYMTIDLEGKPTPTPFNWAIIESDFDKYGNLIEVRHYNKEGVPVQISSPNLEKDFTKVQFIYDENNIALKPKKIFT